MPLPLPKTCPNALIACFLLSALACSAGGDDPDRSEVGSNGSPGGTGGSPGDEMFGGEFQTDGKDPGAGNPRNIGSEELCDGVDENDNGIIDDVDLGKDGLCDCLRIAFLGEISGESGQSTGSFGAWLDARSAVPVQTIDANAPLDASMFNDLQVIIVGNLAARTYGASSGPYYAAADVTALNGWIAGGGGVMSLAGYTSQATAASPSNDLLAPTGVTYDLVTYPGSGTWTEPNTSNGVSYVVSNLLEHATTERVDAVGVFHGYPVVGDGVAIATDRGLNVGMAKEVGDGHVVVWADEWITNDSEWTDRSDLQVARFWLNTLRWLTPENECQVPIPVDLR